MRSSLFLQRSFSRFFLKRVAVRSTRSTERSGCFGPGTGTCARRRSRPSSAAARFVRWLRSRRRTQTTHRRRIRAAAGRDSVAASMTWRNRIRSISISAWRRCRRRGSGGRRRRRWTRRDRWRRRASRARAIGSCWICSFDSRRRIALGFRSRRLLKSGEFLQIPSAGFLFWN